MELKIVDQTTNIFHNAIGISDERATELAKLMDDLCRSYAGKAVKTSDTFYEIAQFCNTPEELVYCAVSHTNYLFIKYGILLCPPSTRPKPSLLN